MSRHRDFRKFSRSEYSTSYSESEEEEDYGSPASPSTAHFMYNRAGTKTNFSSFLANKPSFQGNGEEYYDDYDEKLYQAVDNVYAVVGDAFHEEDVIDALRQANNNEERAVAMLLEQAAKKDKHEEEVFQFEEQEIARSDKAKKQPPKPAASQPKAKAKPQPSSLAQNLSTPAQTAAFPSQFLSATTFGTTNVPPGIKPFDFNEPSPDDIVLQKRKAAFKQKKNEQYNIKDNVKTTVKKEEPKPKTEAKEPEKPPAKKPTEKELEPLAKEVEGISLAEQETKGDVAKKTPVAVKQMTAARRREIEEQINAQQKQGAKEALSMVVIGHVDAGKSTIMGHLLHLTGYVDRKTIHKYEREAKAKGKGSFAYAWVMDEQEEERARGVTMDVAVRRLETEHRRITLLDAPGHRDFVPNMILGTAQADVALLVLDSSTGEFEAGFAADGQTKEHAVLARSLGVTQLAIAVNKMDSVGWSQERFEDVKKSVGNYLKGVGYAPKNLTWVPCSGLLGENLIARKDPKLSAWYSGPTLIQAIDAFRQGARPLDKPFRLSVSDVSKSGSAGVTVAGKIETGIISVNDKVMLMPMGEVCVVKSLQLHEDTVKYAQAGDNIDITLQGIDAAAFRVGCVLCDPEHPVKVSSRFKAQIVVFGVRVPITKGSQAIMHVHTLNEPAFLSRLIAVVDQATGDIKKKRPRCLTEKMTAEVELQTNRPVCVELYKDYRQLGRFMLRSAGRTIAAGIITQIY